MGQLIQMVNYTTVSIGDEVYGVCPITEIELTGVVLKIRSSGVEVPMVNTSKFDNCLITLDSGNELMADLIIKKKVRGGKYYVSLC